MQVTETDVVVIGAGVSGLMAAREAASANARTVVLSLGSGASGWLQGVNVAANADTAAADREAHIGDILREGRGINNPELVRQTVDEVVNAFHRLEADGMVFARENNRYRQRHASGTTRPLCCYVSDVMWGGRAAGVLKDVVRANGGRMLRLRAVSLFEDGSDWGVVAVDPANGEPHLVAAHCVILASGGIGRLYSGSTYPSDVSGASYAMAARAGARLADMEFVQFEPLVGLNPEAVRGYVFPTTLFGDGAVLRDRNNERFVLRHRPQGEAGIGKEALVRILALAAREGRVLDTGGVWLDAQGVPPTVLAAYPWLRRLSEAHDLDLGRSPIEVWPAAHTELGGIVVDENRESSLERLFAVGEAATGIHGAGRLAAGSGTDVLASGLVGGRTAAARAARVTTSINQGRLSRAAHRLFDFTAKADTESSAALDAISVRSAAAMTSAAGVERNGSDLAASMKELRLFLGELRADERLAPSSRWTQIRDQVLVSELIVGGALRREESRGAHLRTDFPAEDSRFAESMPSG